MRVVHEVADEGYLRVFLSPRPRKDSSFSKRYHGMRDRITVIAILSILCRPHL